MTEWREVALGELLSVKHGWAFKGEFFASTGDEIVLTPGNFPIGGGLQFREGRERYYTGPYPREFRLSPGDLLIVMTDLKQDAPILGSPAIVPSQPPVLHNQRLGLVQVKEDVELDVRFLYYLLLSDESRRQLRATATGSTVRHTAPSRIYEVRARVPPIADQVRIGAVLGSIDDLIDNSLRRVEVLEEMARAVYREWFVRFRYPGHEHVPLVDSPLGPIPDGWRFGRVDDLVTLNKATVDPSTVAPSTPAVGLEHIPRRRLTVDDWGEAGALGSRKATFVAGDILFGKIRPYFHKVSVAPVNGICSTDAIVLRPHAEHWGQAVLAMASDEFVAHAVQTSNGTKMPRADWRVIREFPVAIPPSEMARRFSERAHALLAHAQSLMFQARHLASLRDLLLPKLVTGQIDVSHLDLGAFTEAATA